MYIKFAKPPILQQKIHPLIFLFDCCSAFVGMAADSTHGAPIASSSSVEVLVDCHGDGRDPHTTVSVTHLQPPQQRRPRRAKLRPPPPRTRWTPSAIAVSYLTDGSDDDERRRANKRVSQQRLPKSRTRSGRIFNDLDTA